MKPEGKKVTLPLENESEKNESKNYKSGVKN